MSDDDLERLRRLHREGVLSDEEFAAARERLAATGDVPPPPPSPESRADKDEPSRWWIVGLVGVLVAGAVATAAILTGRNNPSSVPLSAPASPTPETTTAGADPSTTEPSIPQTPAESTAPSDRDFSELFDQQRSGVVRIEVVACDGDGIGTGFLVDERIIVTAAHVVDQAVTIGLSAAGETMTGEVVGLDRSMDLAVLRTSRPLGGHRFVFDEEQADVGDEVMTMGFPQGEPLSLSQGAISGLDRQAMGMTDLIQTDAAVNPGNSGGPLVDGQGDVVGVVSLERTDSEGIAYAVPADRAQDAVSRWQANPQAVSTGSCDRPLGPRSDLSVQSDEDIAQIAGMFTAYFEGINQGDYRTAWEQLAPRLQEGSTFEDFRAGVETSYDFDIRVHDATFSGPDTAELWVTFTSLQAPGAGPDGESCTNWSLDYTVRRIAGDWRIYRADGHAGGDASQPC